MAVPLEAEQPAVVQGLSRRAGTFGQAPAAAALHLRLGPKHVELLEGGTLLFTRPLSRKRGSVDGALAALTAAGAVECRVLAVRLAGGGAAGGEERLDALVGVRLLEPFFELDHDAEEAEHIASLVAHWQQLAGLLEEAEAEAEEEEEGGSGSVGGSGVLFAEELCQRWWQSRAQPEAAGGMAGSVQAAAAAAAAAAAPLPGKAEEEERQQECASPGAAAEEANLRDCVFHVALPSDWQQEAPEPPGLACTLFRYQRRCLAWLKWRESLGAAAAGGEGDVKVEAVDEAAAGGAGGGGGGGGMLAPPDPQSSKAVLPRTNLLWQPVVLPSGLRVYHSPLHGGVRRTPVTPPLPEVSGALLCDEMGLGKTVEMMALMLANPPPWKQPAGGEAPSSPADPSSSQQQQQQQQQPDASDDEASEPSAAPAPAGAPAPPRSAGGNGQPPRGGTLVVCPPALLQQWQSELSNHARGALSVEVYDGLRGLGEAAGGGKQKRKKPAQREMELYARLLAGEEIEASFDAEAEVEAALRRLQAADVVLTSFDVLRAEVYFVPSSRSFRRPKKYAVPHCPLLQVRWWRLVIDEAQMVGPLSAAGTMCERMHAWHRWCVTGTPMGSHRNELTDLHALLHTLQHEPFGDAAAWRRLISDPIASGEGAAEAWALLDSVLRPLMWRNTKAVVAQEFHLPHRTLKPTWLSFQAGERAFYEQVVEQARKSREELESFRQQQEAPEGGEDGEEAGTPAARRTRKRRAAKQHERLEHEAADQLTQLRMACIHPQLTKRWKEMAAEGQIGVGATLSMEEIMQRLVHQAQFDLQDAERDLCAHLNTLAMRLVARAEDAGGKGKASSSRAPAAHEDSEEEEGGGQGGPPAKRPRRSKGGLEGASKEALLARAQLLLEQSYRVAEKGIAALDVSMDALKGMPDIEAASGSTVNAWKRLQINTSSQLGKLYATAGREDEAQKMEADVQDKVRYLRAQAEMELQQAQQRLDQLQQQADAARQAFRLHLEQAMERGFVDWGMTRAPRPWLEGLEGRYREAQEEEDQELALQEGNVKAMLGTRVGSALDDVEKRLHAELTQLDRYVGEQHTAAAHRRLQREQARWDAAAGSSAAAAAAGGEAAVLEAGVELLWELTELLPDFKRKTLHAQHVAFFSKQLADRAERKRAEAERRRAEAAAGRADAASGQAAAVAAAGAAGDAADVEMVDLAEEGPQKQRQQPQPAPAQPATEEQGSAAAGAAATAAEAASVLQAAQSGDAFVPSARWVGAVPGYCFKLGDGGLGYHRDVPPDVEAFLTLTRLHAVAAVVGRALLEHQRKLARSMGSEAGLFRGLPLDAVEAKLESVKQQTTLVRLLKEQHVAERTAALKAALQEDLDVDLQQAARLPPLPGGGSVDKLQREVDGLKQRASALLHRVRYMSSRVSEARQLQQAPPGSSQQGQGGEQHPGRGAGGEQPAPPVQQEQQEQGALEVGNGPAVAAAAGPHGSAGPNTAARAANGGAVAGPAGAAHQEHAGGLECPVCLTNVPAGKDIFVFSGCGHAFCKECSSKLVLTQGLCAVCRAKVTAKQVFRVAAGGSSASSGACDPDFEALGQIQPQGEWSAKVEGLLRRILHLATTAPNEKSLVFSQFPEALKMVAMALQTNGVRFVQLLGGRQAARRAVAAFREDDEARVFLLSHRVGAAGLTLVRANHVFLLEPALDPSIEQQAVARVHRIGQQRPVTVSRLLVKDSIEHRVLAVQESKHALFAGADGAAEDTAELATTVEGPVRAEALDQEEVRGLLEAV